MSKHEIKTISKIDFNNEIKSRFVNLVRNSKKYVVINFLLYFKMNISMVFICLEILRRAFLISRI